MNRVSGLGGYRKSPFLAYGLLFGLLLGTGCHTFSGLSRSGQNSRVLFSTDLIAAYGLNEVDIANLQFYLEDELVLRGVSGTMEKNIPRDHYLNIDVQRSRDEILFPDGVPGRVMRLEDLSTLQEIKRMVLKKLGRRHYPALYVSFEEEPSHVLAFEVDRNGIYRLVSKQFVPYARARYRHVSGNLNTGLLVDLRVLEGQIDARRRVAEGNTFDSSPRHRGWDDNGANWLGIALVGVWAYVLLSRKQ